MSGPALPTHRAFPTTQWSIVESVRQEDASGGRPVMAALLRRYVPALHAHLVSRRSLASEEADDVIQGFIADKVLDHDLIGAADRTKGKFRTLLLTALDRYMISALRQRHADKRGGRRTLNLDVLHDEEDVDDPSRAVSAEFDVAWARQTLAEAMERMRRECQSGRREDLWDVFQCAVLGPALEGSPPARYEHLVGRFGFKSPSQMWNAVRTSKQMFIRSLRAVVSEYAADPGCIDAEIQDLRRILSAPGAV